ncbi:MAG TPA: VOC family protein [Candidatus Bilamarchaeum sp.]|nr:VOC family protein [Candidatus Bilamarchaeum sp.]
MGNIAYFEIPADDLERAKKFYMKVFGWSIEKSKMPGIPADYHGVMTGKAKLEKAGDGYEMSQLNSGGMMKRMYPGQPITNYVQVESVDKTMEVIKKNGGKEMGERVNVPGVGRLAFFTDSEGNALAIWEPVKK